MNFGQAIKAAERGSKIAREAWREEGVFVVLMPGQQHHPLLDALPYFAKCTRQQTWHPGWVPSQADMLAEDWIIIL